MDPALRFAVELPPVPATGAVSLETWWEAARAAVRAGAGIVWFTGGPAPEVAGAATPQDAAPSPRWCDACTLAAGAVARVEGASLGVVSGLPADRHPALLAREVTALDIVSAGRATVSVRWAATPGAGDPAGGLSAACAYLGEAVAVCRSVLEDDDPVFEGRHLHVAGAVNRPRPVRAGGLPLFVQVPSGVTGIVRRDDGASFLVRQAAAGAAAVVCTDDPGEIASWRALLDDSAAAAWTGEEPGAAPAVVCRTTLRRASTHRTRPKAADPAAVRCRLEAARAAGAEGVVVRLPVSRRGDEVLRLDEGAAVLLAEDLAVCFDPWRRGEAARA